MIEKFKDGETLADYRIKRRNGRRSALQAIKTELRVRDGIGCRWPGCEFWKQGYRVDAAHVIQHAGHGGDPSLIRSQRHQLARICVRHHQGPFSLHSGDLKVVPLTDRGTDGPCEFHVRNDAAEHGWEVVGGEDDFTFARRRNESASDEDDDAEP